MDSSYQKKSNLISGQVFTPNYPSMWQRLFTRLQPVFLLLALLFIGLLLRSQWETLRNYEWRLHGGWLGLSALFMLAAWALEIEIWRLLLRLLGSQLPFGPATRIWFFAAVVRYIPGNIWQPLSLTLQCQQWRIRPETSLTSLVFYQAVILLAATPIAAIYFGLTGNWGLLTTLLQGAAPLLIGLSAIPVILFLAKPEMLVGLINWALQKLGRPTISTTLSTPRLLGLLVLAATDWLLWGASFAALTFALGQPTASTTDNLSALGAMLHLTAVFPIAYVIGFLSLITPSGIGVREGALYLLLVPLFDGGLITIAALATRLWTIFGEVVMALLTGMVGPWRPMVNTRVTQADLVGVPSPSTLRRTQDIASSGS